MPHLRKKLTTEESGSAGPRSFSLLPKGMSIMDLQVVSCELDWINHFHFIILYLEYQNPFDFLSQISRDKNAHH